MAHLRSILPLSRSDLEFLWLLTAGWDHASLRSARPTAKRLFLVDTVGDSVHRLALHLGAQAAGFQVFDVPSGLDPGSVLETVGGLADAIAVVDDSGRFDALAEGHIPTITVRRDGGGPLEVLAHLYRWYAAGHTLRGLRVVWHGQSPATLSAWCEVTRVMPVRVTHVGERDMVPPGLLQSLRRDGLQGEFRRLATLPEHDVDATPPPDLKTLACTIAAVLEFTQP